MITKEQYDRIEFLKTTVPNMGWLYGDARKPNSKSNSETSHEDFKLLLSILKDVPKNLKIGEYRNGGRGITFGDLLYLVETYTPGSSFTTYYDEYQFFLDHIDPEKYKVAENQKEKDDRIHNIQNNIDDYAISKVTYDKEGDWLSETLTPAKDDIRYLLEQIDRLKKELAQKSEVKEKEVVYVQGSGWCCFYIDGKKSDRVCSYKGVAEIIMDGIPRTVDAVLMSFDNLPDDLQILEDHLKNQSKQKNQARIAELEKELARLKEMS